MSLLLYIGSFIVLAAVLYFFIYVNRKQEIRKYNAMNLQLAKWGYRLTPIDEHDKFRATSYDGKQLDFFLHRNGKITDILSNKYPLSYFKDGRKK
jgi:hypothetical protein